MTSTDSLKPTNGVFQMAYTVADIDEAIQFWSQGLKVGPWFLLDHFTGDEPVYRGRPSKADVAIAMSFSGPMNIELIQANDDHPSVYRELIEKRGYGFHHFGIGTRDFDAAIENYQNDGYELVFRAGVPTGGSVGYMDTLQVLPGFVELIEVGELMEQVFNRFYQASLGWDGGDPVRPFA